MVNRSQIISAARGWIGTPYHHQASVKHVGCDCVGLLRGVWRESIGPEPETAPNYSMDWGEANGDETMLRYFRRHLREIPVSDAQPADIVCMRWRQLVVAKHCLILTMPDHAIHAVNGNPVTEIFVSDWWREKFCFAFSFPGVKE